MVNTNLEQFAIADFIDWHESKRLSLNPYFQRNSVWALSAKTYLIDSILLDMPVPKIYLRSSIDLQTKKTIREVVDGQQRVRAILEFANDEFRLSSRSESFKGKRFSTLSDEEKEQFLSYSLSVDHLINANDDAVLEVFSRLNSYSVRLNHPEIRHAEYQGELKWAIVDLARRHKGLWEDFQLLSLSRRARMLDYSLVAEMCQVLIEGVRDGGQPKITKFYKEFDRDDFDRAPLVSRFDKTMKYITEEIGDAIQDNLASPPHFLMLFAAVADKVVGIKRGDYSEQEWATFDHKKISHREDIVENLKYLNSIISEEIAPGSDLRSFFERSSSSTQRIASRKTRFPVFLKALEGAYR